MPVITIIKWIVIADKEKILTCGGFKNLHKFGVSVPKLFQNRSDAMKYIERNKYVRYKNIEYKKVSVEIKEVNNNE